MPDAEFSPAEVSQAASLLAGARRGVAFTGAGISTESGIPDFRSPSGVWARTRPIPIQEFTASAEARCEYWQQRCALHREFAAALPNAGHRLLAEWEARGLLQGVITQNIDGLHQLAGSKRVLELHGTARKIACLSCEASYEVEPILAQYESNGQPPACNSCGGWLKHATVSFGQMLPPDVLQWSAQLCRQADVILVLGSSLVVEPAASLPRLGLERGAKLVLINREPTPLSSRAEVAIHGEIGRALEAIEARLATGC